MMGTNYYFCWNENRPRKCPTCFSELPTEVNKKELHIGKSLAGWVFRFRSYTQAELMGIGAPEDIIRYEIQSLEDWLRALTQEGPWIENEYGATLSLEELLGVALVRRVPPGGFAQMEGGSHALLLGNGLRCLKEDHPRLGPSHTYTFVDRGIS
jgi:hypothetical protein